MKMSLFKDIVLGIDIGGTTCKCGEIGRAHV